MLVESFITPEFVNIVASFIQDENCNDFTKEEYQRAILKGDKKVAELYHLINRVKTFESKITVPQGINSTEYEEKILNTNINLPIRSFLTEYRVVINEQEYTKTTGNNLVKEEGKYLYYLQYGFNGWNFNYYPRSISDIVTIFYTADIEAADYAMDDYVALIPNKYEDERIKQAMLNIAKQGILRFPNDPRKTKYIDIINLFEKDKNTINTNIAEREVVMIKPTRYPNG